MSARDGHRVGLLFSRESLTAATEITQENATRMAIDEVNAAGGIDGVPLTPISAGVGAQPPDYRQAAEWLCDAQRVPLIFGSHMSSTRKAVLPVVESRRALLFYATLYEGFEYSPNCFYTGSVPNQNSVQLASYVIRHFGNRVLFIGGQYVYPRESNRIMRELYEQAGGEVVAETYLPLNARQDDPAEVLKRAIALRPDAIYSTMVGRDIVKLYRAYRALGLNPARMPIVSLATNETDVAAMTSEEAEGHITAAPYFATLDSGTEPALRAGVPVALWRRQPHHRRRGGRLLPRTWRPTPRAARRLRDAGPRRRAQGRAVRGAPRPRRHRRRHPAHLALAAHRPRQRAARVRNHLCRARRGAAGAVPGRSRAGSRNPGVAVNAPHPSAWPQRHGPARVERPARAGPASAGRRVAPADVAPETHRLRARAAMAAA